MAVQLGDKPEENSREWWQLQLDFLLWCKADLSDGATFELRKIRASFQKTGRVTGEQQKFMVGVRRVLGMGISFDKTVDGVKKSILAKALEFTGGNKSKAAMLLKLKRPTLMDNVRQLKNVDPEDTYPGSVVIESEDNALAENALTKAAQCEQLLKSLLDNDQRNAAIVEALEDTAKAMRQLSASMNERWGKKIRKPANTDKVRAQSA